MTPPPVASLRPVLELLLESGIGLAAAEEQFRIALVHVSLDRAKGNRNRAARMLGVHRNTLNRILQDGDQSGYERPVRLRVEQMRLRYDQPKPVKRAASKPEPIAKTNYDAEGYTPAMRNLEMIEAKQRELRANRLA